MKRAVVLVSILALLSAAMRGQEASATAVASLVLNPQSGNAPTAGGTLSGSGWTCSGGSVPAGPAQVGGNGVSGSASISATGVVSGNFTVSGAAGQSVTITVRAGTSCPVIGPPVYVNASATFTFNPPTATPTPFATNTPTAAAAPTGTSAPAATATPTAAAIPTRTPTAAAVPSGPSPTPTPVSEEAPPPPNPGPVTATISFAGCTPTKDQIELEFVPLFLVGEEPSGDASGPALLVNARKKAGNAATYEFTADSVEAGRLFRVTDKTEDPGCPLAANQAKVWMAGKAVEFEIPLPGKTSLEGCSWGDRSPCEAIVVKGASVHKGESVRETDASVDAPEGSWVLELSYFPGDLKKRDQRFRWAIEMGDVRDVTLQASVLPFPKTKESDYMSPAGLVASWPVHFDKDCGGECEFVVPLAALDTTPAKGKSFTKKVANAVVSPFNAAGKGFKSIFGDGKKKPSGYQASKPQIPSGKPTNYLVSGKTNPLLQPTTFYFRVVPLKDGATAGAPSNTVILQQVEKPDIKIKITPTPTPAPTAYELKILSYHGIIPPLKPDRNCYIVTQEAWPTGLGLTFTTDPSKKVSNTSVKPGALICEPEPDEPSIFEVILSWAESAVDWASDAWKDLKKVAVEVALKYTPLGQECSAVENAGAIPAGSCEQATAFALDAALASMGIPPDIPNFDQLMDQGVEYLAAQTAAQVGIPPEVVQQATQAGGPYAGLALDVAEAKLREELQAQLETQMKEAVTQIQLSYAKNVGFVPDGIPVRPDDYQPPGMTVRVTRKTGVSGGDAGCSFGVNDSVKLPAGVIDNPPPGWESAFNGLTPPKLSAGINYDLFINEADVASGTPNGLDKSLAVPPLAPGEHFDIPMTFKPNWYKSGYSPLGSVPTEDYIQAWQLMHEFGELTLDAKGTCGADTLTLPAKAAVLGQEAGQ